MGYVIGVCDIIDEVGNVIGIIAISVKAAVKGVGE